MPLLLLAVFLSLFTIGKSTDDFITQAKPRCDYCNGAFTFMRIYLKITYFLLWHLSHIAQEEQLQPHELFPLFLFLTITTIIVATIIRRTRLISIVERLDIIHESIVNFSLYL